MTATMTWAGLDVHARSTHAAAINPVSGALPKTAGGEVRRALSPAPT